MDYGGIDRVNLKNGKLFPGFWKVLAVDLSRAFWPPSMIFAIAGCFMVLLINNMNYSTGLDAVYYFSHAASGNFSFLLCLFASVPYAGSCLVEMRNNYNCLFRIRSGKDCYLCSKCIAVFISGFVVAALGCICYILVFSLFFPVSGGIHIDYDGFEQLIYSSNVIVYYGVKIWLLSYLGGSMAVIAFCMSGIVNNVYAVWGFPVVLFYVWNSLGNIFSLPGYVHLRVLLSVPVMGTIYGSIVYSCCFYTTLMFVFMYIGFPYLRRKLTNG